MTTSHQYMMTQVAQGVRLAMAHWQSHTKAPKEKPVAVTNVVPKEEG